MKNKIISELKIALNYLSYPSNNIIIQNTKNPKHGDYSTNIAMILSAKLKKNPYDIADEIIEKLIENNSKNLFNSIDKDGPGFINFKLNNNLFYHEIFEIMKLNNNFGKSNIGQNKSANVEFVSANPTGPLTVGHGRGAMIGDTISNILEWNGYNVHREYYFNNAGRQMRLLGESVYQRYLQLFEKGNNFDEELYQGNYIKDIAKIIKDEYGKSLISEKNSDFFKKKAETLIFQNIKNSLKRLGLEFKHFYNEQELYDSSKIEYLLEKLENYNLLYKKDNATWLKASNIGRDDDKVLIKSTGEPTYRLPDMAYHETKFKRGYDLCVDVFGADHIDTYPDVLAVMNSIGYDSNKIKVIIHQFVTILKNGEQVKMSTRKANFITLDELIDDVGADVVRYFFIMRASSTHLNFDINIAKDQSENNPVFYLQYAHARMCNILKRAEQQSITYLKTSDLSSLEEEMELQLINQLLQFPELVKKTCDTLEPQNIVNYLQELAANFHKYYSHHKVITKDKDLTKARLTLVNALRIGLRNGLYILGISAPRKM